MMAEEFLELMSEVDDELLEKSERSEISMKKRATLYWLRAGALAACVCLVAAVGFAVWQRYGSTYTENIGGSETENVTIISGSRGYRNKFKSKINTEGFA